MDRTHRKLHVVGDRETLVRALHRLQKSGAVCQPHAQQTVLVRRDDPAGIHEGDRATNGAVVTLWKDKSGMGGVVPIKNVIVGRRGNSREIRELKLNEDGRA